MLSLTLFQSKIDKDYARLQAIPQNQMDVASRYVNALQQIRFNGDLSPQGRTNAIQELQNLQIDTLDTLLSTATTLRDSVLTVCTEVCAGPEDDTNSQILEQIQRQRAWARLQPLLSHMQPEELIQQCGEAGDTLSLRTLRDELPAYVQANRAPAGMRVDEQNASTEFTALLAALDAAETPLLPEVSRAVRSVEADIEANFPRLLNNNERAQAAIRNQSDLSVLWSWGGDLFNIEAEKRARVA